MRARESLPSPWGEMPGSPLSASLGESRFCKGWSGDRGGVGFVAVKEWEGELVGELAVVVGWSCGVWWWGRGKMD